MKAKLETVFSDNQSSFRILLTPKLNDVFYWHFHPEFEIVYVESDTGFRHIGNHISKYETNDLVLIGSNVPHLNFDYGVKNIVNTVVIQMKEDFLGEYFISLPELKPIKLLFEKAKSGIVFHGNTKSRVAEMLRGIKEKPQFDQLITLILVFNVLALSHEITILNERPIANATDLKKQERLQMIYHYIETNYQKEIDVNFVAQSCHLTTSAFCRYFKKATQFSFTEYLNQFRINQSKKMLLQNKNITEACFESGFSSVSYFNRMFKKIASENPSEFKKRHLIN